MNFVKFDRALEKTDGKIAALFFGVYELIGIC